MTGAAGDAAGPAALTMTGVRKRFSRSGRWILAGVDLTAGPGTMTVITGGNGSGKSTLLRIAAGATLASRGQVCRAAGPAAYLPERLPARLRMTAAQYLAHMGRLRGLAPAAAAARSRVLLTRLALTPGPDVPIGTLSRGNCQKVALAQALLAPVRLLVLDEPYGGLDDRALAEAAALVGEAVAGGATALLAVPEPDVPHRCDARFRLAAGGLLPEPAQSGGAPQAVSVWPAEGSPAGWARLAAAGSVSELVLELVLAAAAPTAPAAELARMPGVLSWDHDAARGLLTVCTSDGDAFLRRALGSGWSFRSGRRELPGRPGGAG